MARLGGVLVLDSVSIRTPRLSMRDFLEEGLDHKHGILRFNTDLSELLDTSTERQY